MQMLLLLMLFTQLPEPTKTINGISVADVDILDGDMKMTLSVTKGAISLNSVDGLTFIQGTGDKNQSMEFTGKIDYVNNALSTVKYYVNPGEYGTDTLNIVANDQGNTGTGGPKSTQGSLTISLPPPPIALNVPGPLNATEDITRNIVGVNIVSNSGSQGPFNVTLSAEHGTLRLFQTAGITFINGDGNNNQVMTFTGMLPDVNNALSILYYKSLLNYNGIDNVTILVEDVSKKVKITLAPANDAPVILLPPGG